MSLSALTAQETFEIMNMAMNLGTTLKVKGNIAKNDDHFAINLGEGPEKLGLHFNPRYDRSSIVLNSFDGEWGKELVVNHLCFAQGSEITVVMTFDSDGFKVTLPDGHQISFPNRLGLSQVPYLRVEGGSASPP
ncbi:galectin-2-like [Dasypus novemcinctus]|uniref:galectin-2-like n=1 Tax=Dasypus novemcinctus TaxID=9361 RepID=UPI000C84F30D|nr:galectin-2-like [Dasypus novemcinctus]